MVIDSNLLTIAYYILYVNKKIPQYLLINPNRDQGDTGQANGIQPN